MKVKILHIVCLMVAFTTFSCIKAVEAIVKDAGKDVSDNTTSVVDKSKPVSTDVARVAGKPSDKIVFTPKSPPLATIPQQMALRNGISAIHEAQQAITQLQKNLGSELSLPIQDRLDPQYLKPSFATLAGQKLSDAQQNEIANAQAKFVEKVQSGADSIMSALNADIDRLTTMANDIAQSVGSSYTVDDVTQALETMQLDLQKASALTDQFAGKSFYTSLKNIFAQIQEYITGLINDLKAQSEQASIQASAAIERLQSLRAAAPEEAASSSAVVSKAMTQQEIFSKIEDATTIIEQAQDNPSAELTQLLDLNKQIEVAQARYNQFAAMNPALAKKWQARLADLTSEKRVLVSKPEYKAAVDTLATINVQQQEIDSLKHLLGQGSLPPKATVAPEVPRHPTFLPPPPTVAPPRPPIPAKPSAPAIPTAPKPTPKVKVPVGLPDPKTSLGAPPAPPAPPV